MYFNNRNKIGSDESKSEPASHKLSDEESEAMRRAKNEYIKTEKAFQEMMNFNAAQAYGMQSRIDEE